MDQILILLNWIKNKKATINPINSKGNKCFQYAVRVLNYYVLNYEKLEKIRKE